MSGEILFWRILRWSGVFNYWYRKHLTELLFDIERCGIPSEREFALTKYREKLQNFSERGGGK